MAQFNAVQNPLLNDFQGGQMTDLPAYAVASPADLTGLMEIVTPGNAAAGVNYGITLAQLALIIGGGGALTIITSGATYTSVQADTRILVNKTVGSPTAITLLAASSYLQPVLVKDLKGDAATNNITVNFPGTFDGIASPLTISTAYGFIWFNPLPTGNFYATQ
jgi:hypothetical protein